MLIRSCELYWIDFISPALTMLIRSSVQFGILAGIASSAGIDLEVHCQLSGVAVQF